MFVRPWALAALLLLAAPAFGHEPPPPPPQPPAPAAPTAPPAPPPPPLDASTRDFDQVHLDLTVTPDLEKGTVTGKAGLKFSATVDGLATLRLHSQDTEVTSVE